MRPLWRVVKGRSQAYVDAVTAALPDVRVSCPVQSVEVGSTRYKLGPVLKTTARLFQSLIW